MHRNKRISTNIATIVVRACLGMSNFVAAVARKTPTTKLNYKMR